MKRNFILLLSFLIVVSCKGPESNQLFSLGKIEEFKDSKKPLILRSEVTTHPEVLIAGKEVEILFPIPEKTLTLKLKPKDAKELALPKGQSAWVALDGKKDTFFMLINGRIEGQVSIGTRIYRLRSISEDKGILELFDGRKFREAPNDGVETRGTSVKDNAASGDSSCVDSADRIDVMVLYTPDARDASGGVIAIENEVAYAVGRANLAYANSNAAHRLNLIYTGLANYNEPAAGVDSNALLTKLAGTSDGVLDSIHSLRDGVQADLVSLFYETDDSTWCGWGNTVQAANADTTDDSAFSVIQRSCSGSYLSFAHELGHNLGAMHNRADSGASIYDYNFGHIQLASSTAGVDPWRTVMSYNTPCTGGATPDDYCTRIPWFSNPNVSYAGDATGVALTAAQPEHNVNVMALNDGQVSKYRCLKTTSSTANVWMKDRWEDEGGEPDPATAGKAMWQSPYIWVRLNEDTTFEHEHEHENPVLGQSNYVYVKLHNTGGASESGNLELYYASASTSLNNPSSWNLIGSQALTVSNTVDIAKFDWSSLPGSGHYCLLARWNTDGSSLSFSNIDTAVRNSNNLIWRNVNIVDLGASPDSSVNFQMAGDRRFEKTYLLIRTQEVGRNNIAWKSIVNTTLTLDSPALNKNIKLIKGMERIKPGIYTFPLNDATKLIGPFVLKPKEQVKLTIGIRAKSDVIKKISSVLDNPAYYDVTVMQIPESLVKIASTPEELFKQTGQVIGGVSYSLRIPAKKQ